MLIQIQWLDCPYFPMGIFLIYLVCSHDKLTRWHQNHLFAIAGGNFHKG